ncbi:MAG: HflC protein [Nitrospinae bacterium RIFCSPLOWO2_02_FULL_39_110]|nr:MAG: HflC protein [Nitrospinae bacterium RIFCSPHIGHO2_02_39_11]OGV99074.1 MAG: HflC protein [Nitrospinae bacterium RIFCSPHIGHO2_12_FULL_39_42]OGW00643.1 MAG: HflC protein [Nitrospinae bacterium RIFCSPHIGHO2_02_FULL_39_82]OGW04523.1 MAG: HflC protein [Nitrospinae bacterium RIFCSPLOWO2_02_FULL_39_110]OGW07414.1 MAG: HflC protein [Nitrospinae bacterium RIFCSPLOWO2_02_39_17]OGW09672.1 MAG: HflC protein [Nitrospinae bacterium RIFCSPLOWO2_12_FULL_39_93]OGW11838.1 MAG: HflC protein [Nitrospinae b
MKNILLIIFGALLIFFIFLNPFFIVMQTEQVVLTQLGRPIKTIYEPGLYFMVPILQQTRFFDKRILDYDAASAEILTKDKKNLLVDNYAKWRIIDPLKLMITVKDEIGAQARLDDIIYSELRIELGRHSLHEVLSETRGEIMEMVTKRTNEKFTDYGIEVRDVRIKRADLPPENAKAIYGRMKAERERIAMQYRSEGQEEATKIRAETDKEKVILLAEAYKEEQKTKGEGDALSIKIYADAVQSDPEFYTFVRSLEAYKKSLKDKTTVILSPESEFLKYFRTPK